MAAVSRKSPAERVEKVTESSFRALIRVSCLLDRVMQPYFGRFGISRSQWGVLRVLHRAERESLPGLRLMDLGERLLVRPASVTGLVDRMERLGYVSRSSSAHDLRGREVRLTAPGRDLIGRILRNHSLQIASVMGSLSVPEQTRLFALLEKLGSGLEEVLNGKTNGRQLESLITSKGPLEEGTAGFADGNPD